MPRKKVIDSMINWVANLGTPKDKRTQSYFYQNNVVQGELEGLYTNNWIAGKTVDIPVEDMLRNWRRITTPSMSPEQIDEYRKAEVELQVRDKFGRAGKWGRLYGGAVILMGINGAGPMDTPLKLDRVKKGSLKFLHVIDRYDLSVNELNTTDPTKANYRLPEFYTLAGGTTRIHHTRLLRFDGIDIPWRIRQNNQYWGISILQRVYDAITNAKTVGDSIASMTYESSIDVVQVKNLFQQLAAPGGTEKVIERFQLADTIKSFNNMLILDESEQYNKSTVQFGALPDIMTRFLNVVAAAADVPATRMLGQSAQGLNATGEGDLKNYYDMVQAKQEVDLGPKLRYLDEVLVRSTFGSMPKDWSFEFESLWQVPPAAQALIELQNAQRDEIYMRNGVVTSSVVAKELREEQTYTSLDDDYIEVLEELDEEELEESREPEPVQPTQALAKPEPTAPETGESEEPTE
jgi:phage-related protein (TIGR01555 family)